MRWEQVKELRTHLKKRKDKTWQRLHTESKIEGPVEVEKFLDMFLKHIPTLIAGHIPEEMYQRNNFYLSKS